MQNRRRALCLAPILFFQKKINNLMASLYVFPKGDYIVLNDAGGVFLYQLHFSELSMDRTVAGEIAFTHRRDATAIYPIASAPFDEVLDEGGTPYSTIDEEDFLVQFRDAMPRASSPSADPAVLSVLSSTYERVNAIYDGLAPATAQVIEQTTRSAGSYTAEAPTANSCRKVQLIALTGTFSVGGVSYPITTANGVVDAFQAEATSAAKLSDISYTVDASSSVLEIIQY